MSEAVRCVASDSHWYVEVIFDLPGGGACNYNYEYFKGDEPDEDDVAALVPVGRELLKSKIKKSSGHPEYEGPEEEDE